LTKGGAAVVMVCRDLKKAETARNSKREIGDTDIDIFIADFKELGQVRKTAEEIRDRYDTFTCVAA
jgi:short-subunit dehydrogenase